MKKIIRSLQTYVCITYFNKALKQKQNATTDN